MGTHDAAGTGVVHAESAAYMSDQFSLEQQKAIALASARARVAASGKDPNSPEGIQATLQSPEMAPHSLGQKVGFGASDPVMGGGQLAANIGLPPVMPGYVPDATNRAQNANDANKLVADREAAWQQNRAANNERGIEWARGIGSGITTAPLAAAAAPEIGAGIGGAMASGAIQGGTLASVNPVTDNKKSFFEQKRDQILTGMGVGGLTSGVIAGATGKGAQPNANVDFLRERGVEPTIGQNIGPNAAKFEDAVSNVNPAIAAGQKRAIQQFNVAAYNEALKPLEAVEGQSVQYSGPPGRPAIKAVGDRLSKAYEDLKPSLMMPLNNEVLGDLGKVVDEAATTTPDLASRVQRFVLKNILDRTDDNGVLTGEAFKQAESSLTGQAAKYSKSSVGDEREYARYLYDSADVLREHLAKANPDAAEKLTAINNGWAVLTRIEKAADMAPAKDAGIFTPNMLSRAVQAGDTSVRHRQYVRGEALLQPLSDAGSQVLGNTYPNSGTFGRYLAGSSILGGTAAISPAGAGVLGASALAYTPTGQRLAGAAINDFPRSGTARLMRGATIPLTSAAIFGSR